MRRKMILLACVLALSMALIVPVSAAPSAQSGGFWHWVSPGQTLFSIGRLYNVNPWAIAQANALPDPNRIFVGQQLYIPAGPPYYPYGPGWGCRAVHYVQIGETLYGIGRIYGVSPWAIAQANGIYNLNYIYAGQRLCIP